MRHLTLPALETAWSARLARSIHALISAVAMLAALALAVSATPAARVAAAVTIGAAVVCLAWPWRTARWQVLRCAPGGAVQVVDGRGAAVDAQWLAFECVGNLGWLRLRPQGGRAFTWWLAGHQAVRAWALRWHTLRPATTDAAP